MFAESYSIIYELLGPTAYVLLAGATTFVAMFFAVLLPQGTAERGGSEGSDEQASGRPLT